MSLRARLRRERGWPALRIRLVILGVGWGSFFGGCIDSGRDFGALGELPVVLGIQAEVVRDGPNADGLLPVPAGRRRSELLPGDFVEASALVANAEGQVDLATLDPIWTLAASGCIGGDRIADIPDCPDVDTTRREVDRRCIAGRGAAPRFEVPEPFGFSAYGPSIGVSASLCVFAGAPGGLSTDECASRIANRGPDGPPLSVDDCIFGARRVDFGPLARLYEVSPDTFENVSPDFFPPSFVLDLIAPDAGPRVESVEIGIYDAQDRELDLGPRAAGSTIHVPAGGRITLEFEPDLRDQQVQVRIEDGFLVARQQSVNARFRFGDPDVVFFANDPPPYLEVGMEERAFDLWVIATDDTGAQGWAHFTARVEG